MSVIFDILTMPLFEDNEDTLNVDSLASIPIPFLNIEHDIEPSNRLECQTSTTSTVPPPLKKRKINKSVNVTAKHVTNLNDNEEISLSNDSRRKNKATYNSDTNNNVNSNTIDTNNISASTSANSQPDIEKLKNGNIKKSKNVRFFKIPYPCDMCEKVYKIEKCLQNHKLLKHPEEASTHIDNDKDNVSDNQNDPYSTIGHSPASILCPSELEDEVESPAAQTIRNTRSSHSSANFRNRNTNKIYDIPNDKPKDKFWKNTNVDFLPRNKSEWFALNITDEKIEEIKKIKKQNVNNNVKQKKNWSENTNVKHNNYFKDNSITSNLNPDDKITYNLMNLAYSSQSLQKIGHCFKKSDSYTDPCPTCCAKLFDIYALEFEKYLAISRNQSLSQKDKKQRLKELFNKDEYTLLFSRFSTVKSHRKEFYKQPKVLRYNENWYKCFLKMFNDDVFRKQVRIESSELPKLTFKANILCSKVMDDIVNEFLVQTTKKCMVFMHHQNKVTLTKDFIEQYKFEFKTVNTQSLFLERRPKEVARRLYDDYNNRFPKTKDLEILIVDTMLQQCYNDQSLIDLSFESLVYENFKSPKPELKYLMYMKFSKKYLVAINELLMRLLHQLAVRTLELKKRNILEDSSVTYDEIIEACKIIGVFDSAYVYYLENAYKFFEKDLLKEINQK